MTDKLVYAWVPGLPHLLRPDLCANYEVLARACGDVAQEFERRNVKRILYYSTQWLSVLGQSVQARSRVKGLHVDENWYDIASLQFDFLTDLGLVENLVSLSRGVGLQVRAVDYEGFPVDTGTIVANNLLNKAGIKTSMYSCCVYSDYAETKRIGEIARQAALSLDGVTAIVAVSGLSGRYYTDVINYNDDSIRDPVDDKWNKKMLRAMSEGRWNDVSSMREQFCQATKADMGLKALAFLEGAGACASGKRLKTIEYSAIYGTGAAVMLGE